MDQYWSKTLLIFSTIFLTVTTDNPCDLFTTEHDTETGQFKLKVENCLDSPPSVSEFQTLVGENAHLITHVTISHALIDNPDQLTWICDFESLYYLDLAFNKLTNLPDCLSKLTSLRELYANNNFIKDVDKDLFKLPNLTTVLLQSNSITSMDLETWKAIDSSNVTLLNLAKNLISTLPEKITNLQFLNLENLDISKNNFTCDCFSLWIKNWVKDQQSLLLNKDKIMCTNYAIKVPKALLWTKDDEFVCQKTPRSKYDAKLTALIIAFFIVVLILPLLAGGALYLIYRHRLEIFRRWRWHPFDEDNCEKQTMHYDVFVACAPTNEDWCENKVISFLQDQEFKVLFQKDLPDHADRGQQMRDTVSESKRTICVLSHDFLNSYVCMQALETVLSQDLRTKRRRTILITFAGATVNDIKSKLDTVPRDITCINCNSRHFYDDLLYWLPTKTMEGSSRDYDVAVRDDIPLEEVHDD